MFFLKSAYNNKYLVKVIFFLLFHSLHFALFIYLKQYRDKIAGMKLMHAGEFEESAKLIIIFSPVQVRSGNLGEKSSHPLSTSIY